MLLQEPPDQNRFPAWSALRELARPPRHPVPAAPLGHLALDRSVARQELGGMVLRLGR